MLTSSATIRHLWRETGEIREARDLATKYMMSLGFDQDTTGSFCLALGEAVANAIVHGDGAKTKLWFGSCAGVAVANFLIWNHFDGTPPDFRYRPLDQLSLEKESGRGIALMQNLGGQFTGCVEAELHRVRVTYSVKRVPNLLVAATA